MLRVWDEAAGAAVAEGGVLVSNPREGRDDGPYLCASDSPSGASTQTGRVAGSAAQSSFGLRFLYTARPWSPVGEVYHYRARWYAPDCARFLTRDPVGYAAGPTHYGYVGGNPINRIDPLGMDWWNPTTWLDPEPVDLLRPPLQPLPQIGQEGEMLDAFGGGVDDGYIGWSNGFIETMTFGYADNYSDPCNDDQQFGSMMGTVSGIAAQGALGDAALQGALNGLAGGGTRVFYSGGGGGAFDEALIAANHYGGATITQTRLGSIGRATQRIAGDDSVIANEMWKFLSAIYANGARGPVIAVIREPHRAKSVWEMVEHPILRSRRIVIGHF